MMFGKYLNFISKTEFFFFFFYSILNFALMRTIGVNAKMVFLNMSLSLMEPINHCEKQQLTNISMLSRCNVCIFGFLS